MITPQQDETNYGIEPTEQPDTSIHKLPVDEKPAVDARTEVHANDIQV